MRSQLKCLANKLLAPLNLEIQRINKSLVRETSCIKGYLGSHEIEESERLGMEL